jgi:hypothetical protein
LGFTIYNIEEIWWIVVEVSSQPIGKSLVNRSSSRVEEDSNAGTHAPLSPGLNLLVTRLFDVKPETDAPATETMKQPCRHASNREDSLPVPRANTHKKVLDATEFPPDAPFEELSAAVKGAPPDLVAPLLEEYGDLASIATGGVIESSEQNGDRTNLTIGHVSRETIRR